MQKFRKKPVVVEAIRFFDKSTLVKTMKICPIDQEKCSYYICDPWCVLCGELTINGGTMALETLKGVKEIGGFPVIVMDDLKVEKPELFNESGAMDYAKFEAEIRPKFPIQIRHDKNSISFTIQNGPIKEVGVNGCQVDTVIEAAKTILEGLQDQFPCHENAAAIFKLNEALNWLHARKRNREKRGVEGFNKA